MDSAEGGIPPSGLPLPDSFLGFLEENGVDPSVYSANCSIPRYIRLKPGCEPQLSEIEDELNCKLVNLVWLPGFFAIPPHVQIARSDAYRKGKIYGMDAASGAAIIALNVLQGDHVLDLCAAPGAKLCMISDLLGNSGMITGVDVARQRLAACRTMLQKYALGERCRLFVADGTSFSLLPVSSHLDAKSYSEIPDIFSEWSSKRRWKDRKDAKRSMRAGLASPNELPELIFYGRHAGVIGLCKSELFQARSESEISVSGYDKVLVDAECTHDGSIKHIHKFEQWGWDTLQRRVLNAQRTDNLMDLQVTFEASDQWIQIIKSWWLIGLQHLQASTGCLTVAQNEDVVERFLSGNPSADLQDVDAAKSWPCRMGSIPKTLRFDPSTSQTSGLFIAKFTKRATQ
ncbi:hypothetical protein Taro_041413 [Colocasia esculenta]|uniref:SAM-dependent MTase RsmB/NOP-type domain-containing protein n=1 Tax=Colocasia esculenta TaxID=4460 RepID=A0A843WLL6_COLES|nr:hypothetical protein [Colocasia esculenta]